MVINIRLSLGRWFESVSRDLFFFFSYEFSITLKSKNDEFIIYIYIYDDGDIEWAEFVDCQSTRNYHLQN